MAVRTGKKLGMRSKPEELSAVEQAVIAAMRTNPELQQGLVGLVAEMDGRIATADQAEDAIAERVRQLARTALTSWAQKRQQTVAQAQPAKGLVRHGKKNSAG